MPSRTTKPVSWNARAQADTDKAVQRFGFGSDSEALRVAVHVLAEMEFTVNVTGMVKVQSTWKEEAHD